LPDQSQESKCVEGVILDNEMCGRTEGIKNSDVTEEVPSN